MDKSQLGRAGELALAFYALVTSDGSLELYDPLVDDDHVDLVGGLRGELPRLGIQVKTSDGVDRDGLIEARASYPAGGLRSDPAFIYAVLLLAEVSIAVAWLVPSPDFNRLAYRTGSAGREVLEFRASPEGEDVFAPFRTPAVGIGPALMRMLPPASPAWLRSISASR